MIDNPMCVSEVIFMIDWIIGVLGGVQMQTPNLGEGEAVEGRGW